MATLIRSAQLASDAMVLPLGNAQHAAPAIAPASESIPARVYEAEPLPTSQPDIEPIAHAGIYGSKSTSEVAVLADTPPPAPELDPEVKRALLAEIEAARDAAVHEGYETGHEQGLIDAKHSLQTQIDAVNTLFTTATDALQTQLTGLEDIVVSLAFETVCKIIGGALHDRDGVLAVVREVMSNVKDSEPITIRVSPADYYQLVGDQAALTQSHYSSSLTLVPDDRVVLGGCLIETAGGSLDGRLETQLQQVKDALLSAQRQRTDWKDAPHAV